MSIIDNYYRYDVTQDEIIKYGQLFLAILFVICAVAASSFYREPKRLAWVIGVINSLASTIIGATYLYYKVPQYKAFFLFGDDGYKIFHSIDNIAVIFCLWFGLANIVDILFGLIFYRKQIGLLTGYVHHSVYLWIMVVSTTGHGGFLTATPFCSTFLFMLIEEIPTFLLGFGYIYPQFRTDLGFGVTFFLLRIVYHGYMLIYSIYSGTETVVISILILTLILHLNWFYAWVTKYGLKPTNKKKSIE